MCVVELRLAFELGFALHSRYNRPRQLSCLWPTDLRPTNQLTPRQRVEPAPTRRQFSCIECTFCWKYGKFNGRTGCPDLCRDHSLECQGHEHCGAGRFCDHDLFTCHGETRCGQCSRCGGWKHRSSDRHLEGGAQSARGAFCLDGALQLSSRDVVPDPAAHWCPQIAKSVSLEPQMPSPGAMIAARIVQGTSLPQRHAELPTEIGGRTAAVQQLVVGVQVVHVRVSCLAITVLCRVGRRQHPKNHNQVTAHQHRGQPRCYRVSFGLLVPSRAFGEKRTPDSPR